MALLGIDCRFASAHTGLGTYTRELVSALLAHPQPWHVVLFVSKTSDPWISHLPAGVRIIPLPFTHYSLAEQLRFPGIIRRSGIRALFSPQFNVPFFCPVPFVCTVHDLILHQYPNRASPLRQLGYRLLFWHAVRSARHIICVSQSTRDALVHAYPSVDTASVSVIAPGVSSSFHPRSAQEQGFIRRRYDLPEEFVLYVGNAKQHKNVQMLIDAFATSGRGAVELVLVTGGKEASALSLAPRVRTLRDVDQQDLPALYSTARGFVSPSLAEGFGLPMLEAQACGCPVLAIRRDSIPAECAAQAILVEPTVAALAEGLKQLLSTHDRRVLSADARARYSWHSTAEHVADILTTVLRS